jgi:hypothetical protein
MECLGLAAWLGGGRTGDTSNFKHLRDDIYAPEKADEFKAVVNADLDNVALQFYARRSGAEQPGYAFIHKSFGEYLTARALIEAGDKWLEDYRSRPRPERFGSDWLKLTGQQPITSEIRQFMVDEARLRVKRRASDDPDLQSARERIEMLAKVATWVLHHGLPAHADVGGESNSVNWRRREQIQRNAEEALYTLIHVWAEAGYPMALLNASGPQGWSVGPIKINWPGYVSASSLVRRMNREQYVSIFSLMLVGFSWGWSRGEDFKLFSRWTLQDQFFHFVDLSGFDLSGSDLSDSAFLQCSFRGANLRGASLRNSKFGLTFSSLLRMAPQRKTDLWETEVEGADLQGADLRETEGLTLKMVRSAIVDNDTKLPPDLRKPLGKARKPLTL